MKKVIFSSSNWARKAINFNVQYKCNSLLDMKFQKAEKLSKKTLKILMFVTHPAKSDQEPV